MPNLENLQNFYVTSETPESIHMPNQNNRQPVQSQHEVAIQIPYSVILNRIFEKIFKFCFLFILDFGNFKY